MTLTVVVIGLADIQYAPSEVDVQRALADRDERQTAAAESTGDVTDSTLEDMKLDGASVDSYDEASVYHSDRACRDLAAIDSDYSCALLKPPIVIPVDQALPYKYIPVSSQPSLSPSPHRSCALSRHLESCPVS